MTAMTLEYRDDTMDLERELDLVIGDLEFDLPEAGAMRAYPTGTCAGSYCA